MVDCPAGNAYEICVTGFGFVSPVLQDEEPEPPSLGSGWRQPPKGAFSRAAGAVIWFFLARKGGCMVFTSSPAH